MLQDTAVVFHLPAKIMQSSAKHIPIPIHIPIASADPLDAIAAVTHPWPYPYYRRLALQKTLRWDAALKLWIAADPALIREVMRHPDCLVRPLMQAVPAAIDGPAGAVFGELARMNEFERHATRRAAVDQVLATIGEEKAARHARKVASLLLQSGADHVIRPQQLNDFVREAPVRTMASLLGFADAELARIARWTQAFAACVSPLANTAQITAQIAAAHDAAPLLLAALRRLPATSTANAPHEDARLANLLGMLSQTYEASAGLLGNCIVAACNGALVDTEDDAARLVQATMRDDPPVHNTRRFAARDLTIGGASVQAGQAILLILATPAGDERFGHGHHRCPGSRLAQIIAAQSLHALLTHATLPPLRWRYRPSPNARLPEFLEDLQ